VYKPFHWCNRDESSNRPETYALPSSSLIQEVR
jgi:hypothetical protein